VSQGIKMFESAELGHKVSTEAYKREEPQLRLELLNAQFELSETCAFQVILLAGGVDGAGKGETVNLLNEWMDPRLIATNAMAQASDEEKERPPMWRFWRALPPKGAIGVFFGSWYTSPILDRVIGETSAGEFDHLIDDIRHFERMLADEGALILKFWFHLSKEQQRKRLKKLSKDPEQSWRVMDEDWHRFKAYDKFRAVCEHALTQTNAAYAPWIVIEGSNERYRHLMVGRTLRDALSERLANPAKTARTPVTPLANNPEPVDGVTVLNAPGTLDSDYRGEVGVILVNLGQETFEICRGERIAQLVVAPVVRCELEVAVQLARSARGAGGFGHTGL